MSLFPHLAFRCLTFPAKLRYPSGLVQKIRQPPRLLTVNVGLLTRNASYVAYLLRLLPQGVGFEKRILERGPPVPGLPWPRSIHRPADMMGVRPQHYARNVYRLIVSAHGLTPRVPTRQRQRKDQIVMRAPPGLVGKMAARGVFIEGEELARKSVSEGERLYNYYPRCRRSLLIYHCHLRLSHRC